MIKKILAIDPGTLISGYVLVEITPEFKILEHEIVSNDIIFHKINDIEKTNVRVIIEAISSMGQRIGESTISTIFFTGRIYELCVQSEIKVSLIERKTVKKTLCPKVRAKDKDIRAKLISLFGEPGTKKNPGKLYGIKTHEWQALGACIAYLIKEGIKFD